MLAFTYYDTVILSLGSLLLGIVMLIRGGTWAIDSGVFVANRFGISPMVVGFTIIAFGTSLPELVVSVFANLQGSPGIALGNVLGSNIANILMVAGFVSIFITMKVAVNKALIRDLVFMILATIALIALLHYGDISRTAGFLMVAVLLAYIFFQYKTSKSEEYEANKFEDTRFQSNNIAYATLLLGLVFIAVGAEFLVKGARVIAELIGVSESVIALSIIALGTSLPELSTSIIAARKGQASMVIGNIIGSNVFNILMIIGVSAMARPIVQGSFSSQIVNFDIWVTLLVSLCFLFVLLIFGRINRVVGSVFFLLYVSYNIYIYVVNISV